MLKLGGKERKPSNRDTVDNQEEVVLKIVLSLGYKTCTPFKNEYDTPSK
jgi:hypothetical protein